MSSVKSNYIYWDVTNELADRLRVLVSPKNAGHRGLDNEIAAIFEELREAVELKK